MNIYDDLGYGKRMSREEKEQCKEEYKKMMDLYRAKRDKPKTERQIVIEEKRF